MAEPLSGPVCCPVCMKSFSSKEFFLQHLLSHVPENETSHQVKSKIYRCPMCIKTFFYVHHLRYHMEAHLHTSPKSRRRRTLRKASRFRRIVPDDLVQQCECGLSFPSEETLAVHIETRHQPGHALVATTELPPEQGQVGQKERIVSISQWSDTTGILTSASIDSDQVYTPPSESGKEQSRDDDEQEVARPSGKSSVDTGTGTSISYQNVQVPAGKRSRGTPASVTQSDIDTSAYECTFCGHRSDTSEQFWKHIKTHKGQGAPQCAVCRLHFRDPTDLVRHTRKHSGERPYQCGQCRKAFAVKSTLTKHLETCTQGSKHEQKTTNDSYKPDNVRHSRSRKLAVYKCGICSVYCDNENMFRHHLCSHNGQDRITCAVCKKGFEFPHEMVLHTRVHRKLWPYKCDKCLKTFSSRSALQGHLDTECSDCPRDHRVEATPINVVKHIDSAINTVLKNHNTSSKIPESFSASNTDGSTPVPTPSTGPQPRQSMHLEKINEGLEIEETSSGIREFTPVACDTGDTKEANTGLAKPPLNGGLAKPELTSSEKLTTVVIQCPSGAPCSTPDSHPGVSSKGTPKASTGVSGGNLVIGSDGFSDEEELDSPPGSPTTTLISLGLPACNITSTKLSEQRNASAAGNGHILPVKLTLMCMVCGVRCPDLEGFYKHLIGHEDRQFRCGECKNVFIDAETLAMHVGFHTGDHDVLSDKSLQLPDKGAESTDIMTHHLSYLCNICGEQLHNEKDCLNHTKSHQKLGCYRCSVCKDEFSQPYELVRHSRIHTGERPYSCHICQETFARTSTVNRHVRLKHGSEGKSVRKQRGRQSKIKGIPCRKKKIIRKGGALVAGKGRASIESSASLDCPKVSSIPDLRSATRTPGAGTPGRLVADRKPKSSVFGFHVADRQPKSRCRLCKLEFLNANLLRQHTTTHFRKTYRCNLCNRFFPTLKQRNIHMTAHRVGELGLYECVVCDAVFPRKLDLKSHIKEHFREKPYGARSSPDNAKFSKSSNDNPRHMENTLTHFTPHSKAENKSVALKYSCPVCGEIFDEKTLIMQHLKTHNKKQVYQCIVCDRVFSHEAFLTKHSRVHWMHCVDVE